MAVRQGHRRARDARHARHRRAGRVLRAVPARGDLGCGRPAGGRRGRAVAGPAGGADHPRDVAAGAGVRDPGRHGDPAPGTLAGGGRCPRSAPTSSTSSRGCPRCSSSVGPAPRSRRSAASRRRTAAPPWRRFVSRSCRPRCWSSSRRSRSRSWRSRPGCGWSAARWTCARGWWSSCWPRRRTGRCGRLGAQFHASADGLAAAERVFAILDTPVAQRATAPAGVAVRPDPVHHPRRGAHGRPTAATAPPSPRST